MNSIISFGQSALGGLWNVVAALILLAVAFLVAGIVKKLVLKLLDKINAKKVLDATGVKDGVTGSPLEFVAKFVYLLVFLLFVPGILSLLGLDSVSAPITQILNTIWGFLPNILGAAIILVIGFMIAKLVRQLLVPVFERLNIDKLQEKAGLEVSESGKLSSVLAYIVYVLILIPVIIAALNVLGIKAISDPAISMLNTIFAFIPNIFVAVIIIIIGVMIAKFCGMIVEKLLAASGLDAKLDELLSEKMRASGKFVFSAIVGMTIRVIVTIFFAVEAINVLHLQVLTAIGSAVIAYLPFAISALVVLAIAFFAASAAENAILKQSGQKGWAFGAKVAILAVGVIMTLNQLNIATEIVNSAFVLILAAVAVAFAIAFGLGGRDFASRTLSKLESQNTKPAAKK